MTIFLKFHLNLEEIPDLRVLIAPPLSVRSEGVAHRLQIKSKGFLLAAHLKRVHRLLWPIS